MTNTPPFAQTDDDVRQIDNELDDEELDETPLSDGEETSGYEELKTLAVLARKKGDRSSYVLGDITLRVVNLAEKAGDRIRWAREAGDEPSAEDLELSENAKTILKKFANDVGVKHDHILYFKRVAEVFPKGHRIRHSTLTFSHARALYTVESESDREAFVEMAETQQLSVNALRELVGKQKTDAGVEAGLYKCIFCDHTITDPKTLVVIRNQGRSSMMCSWEHAALYCQNQQNIAEGLGNSLAPSIAAQLEEEAVELPTYQPEILEI